MSQRGVVELSAVAAALADPGMAAADVAQGGMAQGGFIDLAKVAA